MIYTKTCCFVFFFVVFFVFIFVFFQAEDGIRDLVRSRGLGDVYKRQIFAMLLLLLVATVFVISPANLIASITPDWMTIGIITMLIFAYYLISTCLLYTSDAADERSSVDLGGRRIIKKKKT